MPMASSIVTHRVAGIHSQSGVDVSQVRVTVSGRRHLGHRGVVDVALLLWLLPLVGRTRILADAARARLTTRVSCSFTQELKGGVLSTIRWLLNTLLGVLLVAAASAVVSSRGRLA
jgi:hypothetical protein